jgi:hypothetical protein
MRANLNDDPDELHCKKKTLDKLCDKAAQVEKTAASTCANAQSLSHDVLWDLSIERYYYDDASKHLFGASAQFCDRQLEAAQEHTIKTVGHLHLTRETLRSKFLPAQPPTLPASTSPNQGAGGE